MINSGKSKWNLRNLTVTWMGRGWIQFKVKTASWAQRGAIPQPLIPKYTRNIEVAGDWDVFQQLAVGCAYSAAIWLASSPSILPWQYNEEAFLASVLRVAGRSLHTLTHKHLQILLLCHSAVAHVPQYTTDVLGSRTLFYFYFFTKEWPFSALMQPLVFSNFLSSELWGSVCVISIWLLIGAA